MSVEIGRVDTFADVKRDKAQALKPLEEAAEIYAQWQAMQDCTDDCKKCEMPCINWDLCITECCDTIQAICNLLASMGVVDISHAMMNVREKNEKRGRLYGQGK